MDFATLGGTLSSSFGNDDLKLTIFNVGTTLPWILAKYRQSRREDTEPENRGRIQ